MAKYVYIYKGGVLPDTEEESKRLVQAWMEFVAGLGDAVVDGGNRFVASKSVNGNATSGATGYSIVTAPTLDEAIEMARPCPVFESGGDVEVHETVTETM